MSSRMRLMRVVGLVVLVAPAAALACSGPLCEDQFSSIPGAGQTIPANAPAVGVRAAIFSEVNDDGGTQILRSQVKFVGLGLPDGGAAGAAVERDDGFLFFPSGGFVEGSQYSLSWDAGACSSSGTFLAGPSAPVPTTSAVLSVETFATVPGSTVAACFSPQVATQHAYLKIVPNAQMVPWLPLTRWELEVDGKNWATSTYGRVTSAPLIGSRTANGDHAISSIWVGCAGAGAFLGPGMHEARLLGRIAGLDASVPSNTTTVSFDCSTNGSDGGSGGGGGSGCSSTGGPGSLAVLLVALLWLTRNRQQRHAP